MNLVFQYQLENPESDNRGQLGGMPRSLFYSQMKDVSTKSFSNYAEAIGAEYLFSDQPYFDDRVDTYLWMLYDIARLWVDPYFDKYDDILYVDTDIIVNTQENIFDYHEGDLSGVLESDIVDDSGKQRYNPWDSNDVKYTNIALTYLKSNVPLAECHVLPPNLPSKVLCYNTGVMVWSKEGRQKAREKFDGWVGWYNNGVELGNPSWLNNDQFYISAQSIKHDLDLNFLDQKWNDSPHYGDRNTLLKSNFLHFSGGNGKEKMMKYFDEGWFPMLKPGDL